MPPPLRVGLGELKLLMSIWQEISVLTVDWMTVRSRLDFAFALR